MLLLLDWSTHALLLGVYGCHVKLELAHPEQIVSESIAHIRQERVLEKAFHAKQQQHNDDGDGYGERDDQSAYEGDEGGSPHEESSVVFDERTMRLIQSQFTALEQQQQADDDDNHHKHKSGCVSCALLPALIGTVGLCIDEQQLLEFLDEIGASRDTLVSFAECVDILSLLAESEMGGNSGGGRRTYDDDDNYDGALEEQDDEDDD